MPTNAASDSWEDLWCSEEMLLFAPDNAESINEELLMVWAAGDVLTEAEVNAVGLEIAVIVEVNAVGLEVAVIVEVKL